MRPFEISMVVSQPGMMGQVMGSDTSVAGVDDLLEPGTHRDNQNRITHTRRAEPSSNHIRRHRDEVISCF